MDMDLFQLGVVKNWIKKGGGTGGSSGPADWNTMRNKPFGEVTELVEIFPETELTVIEDEGAALITSALGLVVGEKYIVYYQGVEYVCVAQTFTQAGHTATALGDVGVMTGGTSTGEPFLLAEFPPELAAQFGASVMVAPADGSETFTLAIKQEQTVIKPIDPMYLPDTVATKADLEAAIGTAIGGSY